MRIRIFSAIVAFMFIFSSCSEDFTVNNEPQGQQAGIEDAFLDAPVEIITLKSGVVVEKRGDHYIIGGDVILTDSQLMALDEIGSFFSSDLNESVDTTGAIKMLVQSGMGHYFPDRSSSNLKAFGVYPTSLNTWAMVRYTLDTNLTWTQLIAITAAIEHIELNSNVRFYNATGEPTTYNGIPLDYVNFINVFTNTSSSSMGRVGGKQNINLSQFVDAGLVIHEICHAVGLFHEHQRFDRDSYININWNNINSDNQHNFTKIIHNYYGIGTFDWNSITLYGSDAFAINTSIPVMTRVDNGNTFIAQRNGLSVLDRSWVNTLYLPYVARPDTWRDLAEIVYKPNNTIMTSQEREDLIRSLNGGLLPPPVYTVTFDLNGAWGTPPPPKMVTSGGYYAAVPSPTPSRLGYTFGGWYDNPACTGYQVNFYTYKIISNKTFYAKWSTPVSVYSVEITNDTYYNFSSIDFYLFAKVGGSSSLTQIGSGYIGNMSASSGAGGQCTLSVSPGTAISELTLYIGSCPNTNASFYLSAWSGYGLNGARKSVSVSSSCGNVQLNLTPNSTTARSSEFISVRFE